MDYNTIMNLWFYDFQNILASFQRILEQRNKAEEDEAKRQGYDTNKFTPNNLMKSANNMMKSPMGGSGFKMPNMGGLKL